MVGALSGAFSGIMFACYVIMIKQARMHPAPFSILSFAVVFLLGILIIPFLDYQVAEGNYHLYGLDRFALPLLLWELIS